MRNETLQVEKTSPSAGKTSQVWEDTTKCWRRLTALGGTFRCREFLRVR